LITLAQMKIPDRPAVTPAPSTRRGVGAGHDDHRSQLVAIDR
jgi:hypothetical protein